MKKVLMKGNEALAEAAVRAGCRLFFGYPITPSTEIPEYMSRRLVDLGGEFVQAESEVAAINMVYGAAAVGKRVMTATSSPGFSLKQEGLSYLAAAQLPAVVVNVMRKGPGLGGLGPTQADYFQITKGGGHGDYHPISLAPHNIQEVADLTGEAFELANRYRNPVIIALDGVLGQMMEPVEFKEQLDEVSQAQKMDWPADGCKNRATRYIGSYCLAPEVGEKHCLVLEQKHQLMSTNEQRWETYRMDDTKYLIVAFGTAARIVKTAVDVLRQEDIRVGLIRPITLWPFPKKAFLGLDAIEGTMVVELSAGQMIEDVKLALDCAIPVKFYGRQGGMLPVPEDLVAAFKASLL